MQTMVIFWLFIRNKDGRRDWFQTTAEHDVVWSICDRDSGELLSYAVHTWTGNASFTRNLTSWSVRF